MGAMASQIISLTSVYSTIYSDANQRKHQSSALLAFVRGIHRWPVNSPHKWPVTRKMFPFDDVMMITLKLQGRNRSDLPRLRILITLMTNKIFVMLCSFFSFWYNFGVLKQDKFEVSHYFLENCWKKFHHIWHDDVLWQGFLYIYDIRPWLRGPLGKEMSWHSKRAGFCIYYSVQKTSWLFAWWRHQMETFSALLALCAGNSSVSGEFPSQRPVTRSFDVFFDLRLNKRLSKQSWGWWFEPIMTSL